MPQRNDIDPKRTSALISSFIISQTVGAIDFRSAQTGQNLGDRYAKRHALKALAAAAFGTRRYAGIGRGSTAQGATWATTAAPAPAICLDRLLHRRQYWWGMG
jgi:hypothetical protein